MTEDVKKPASQKRLTETEWQEITSAWERGEATLASLSKKYDIAIPNVHAGLKKRNSVKNSRLEQVKGEIEASAIDEAERRRTHVRDLKDRYNNYADFIGKATIGKLAKAKQDKVSFVTIAGEINVLKAASQALKNVRDELWHVNGLYIDTLADETPEELQIGVMTEDDESLIRQIQEDKNFQESDQTISLDDLGNDFE